MTQDTLFGAPAEHSAETQYEHYGKKLGGAPEPAGILELCRALNVRFLRLTFTDILGHTKNVEVPASQFQKALDGEIMFDGSSIKGFVRIEESDMLLKPDLRTFRIFPWGNPEARVARLICDVYDTDDRPSPAIPRLALKRTADEGRAAGLHDERGRRGGVLPLPARRGRLRDDDHARRAAATSTSPPWTSGRRRAG